LIRSFAVMHALSLGFDPRGLLTMEISLSGARYGRPGEVDRFARQLVDRIQSIPGVESASIASALPLFGFTDMIFDIPGQPRPDGKRFAGDVQWRYVSPQYFRLLRIPLRSGRLLREQEPGRSVVISQQMARRFWPHSNPVGQAIDLGAGLGPGFEAGATEIVGVVGDVRERFDQASGSPVMYLLPSQIPERAMALMNQWGGAAVLVRAVPGVNPNNLGRPVQNELRAIAGLSATNVRTMEQAGLESTPRHNFTLFLLGLFAAAATLLAAIGVYGVMAYSVEQKRHEIGIRMALGASRSATLTLVIRNALRMAVIGIVAGGAASAAMTRLMRSQLFGIDPLDPMTFATVPFILLAVASAAAYIPALRASRVDPIIALRAE
jgi:putative ABC transport system permease protein